MAAREVVRPGRDDEECSWDAVVRPGNFTFRGARRDAERADYERKGVK